MRWYHKILIAIAVIFLLGAVVMLLWNALVPELFGLAEITYGQAMGIFVLSRLLFGGHNHDHKHPRDPRRIARSYRPWPYNWLEENSVCGQDKEPVQDGKGEGQESPQASRGDV